MRLKMPRSQRFDQPRTDVILYLNKWRADQEVRLITDNSVEECNQQMQGLKVHSVVSVSKDVNQDFGISNN